MKNHISLLFTMALVAAVTCGCKVGPDDPGLTWASRDGRIIATWKLIDLDNKITDVNGSGTQTTTSTYDGSIATVTTAGFTFTYSYALEMMIGEDGALQITETVDGDVTTVNDYWEWGNADKNKSTIVLNGYGAGAQPYSIRRLSSKDLVLERNTKTVEVNNGSTDSHEENELLTFEAVE
jgi:hypothetical protein